MTKFTKYNKYAWFAVFLEIFFLRILYMISPDLYAKINILTLIVATYAVFAFLGTGWIGSEIRIIPTKAAFQFLDLVKNVYFKMIFRFAFTGLHVYILFKIVLYVFHADCIRRYGIGVCVPR